MNRRGLDYVINYRGGKKARRIARDLNALAKSGEVDREVRSFYATARNTWGYFGGAVAVKRRVAEYRPVTETVSS